MSFFFLNEIQAEVRESLQTSIEAESEAFRTLSDFDDLGPIKLPVAPNFTQEELDYIKSFGQEDLIKIAEENGFEFTAASITPFKAPGRGNLTFYLKPESIGNFIEAHPELIDHQMPPNAYSIRMSINYHVITKIAKVYSGYLGEDSLQWVFLGVEYGGGSWVQQIAPTYYSHEGIYNNLITTKSLQRGS